MTQKLKIPTLSLAKKIFLFLLCSFFFIGNNFAQDNKAEIINLDEIVAELEKNPRYLEENPEIGQKVMEQLMSDPAIKAQLEAEASQMDSHSSLILEENYKQISFLLKQVLQVIQELSQVVSNNQLQKLNKKETLARLQELQQLVVEVEKGPVLVVNIHNVNFLLNFTQVMTAYMRHIIQFGLTTFPQFDPNLIITRGPQRTLEELQSAIQDINKAVIKLKAEERQVGRNWFQQQFKKARSLFDDYKITSKLMYTAAGSFLVYYFLSQLHMAYAEKTPNSKEFLLNINEIAASNEFSSDDKLKAIVEYSKNQITNSQKNSWLRNTPYLGWITDLPILNTVTNTIENFGQLNGAMKLFGIIMVAGLASAKWEKKLFSMDNITDMMKFQAKTWWQQGKTRCINFANYLSGDPSIKNGHSWLIDPRYTFDDIIGHEAFKNQLARYVEYVLDPEKFDRAGATPERGILFAGPPQTGKTMLAEATAGEILKRQMMNGNTDKFSFLVFTPAEINENGIDFILWLAEAQAPCIVFIDELDLYGLQRERNTKMLGEFLTAMSGAMNTEKSKRIILLGATNKPENLDQALLQHGRFGKILYFDYPCYEERRQFFNKKLKTDLGLTFADSFVEKLTRETENCTYNDLKAIVTTALDDAKVHNATITEQHLENALDEEVRNIVLQKTKLPESQKRILATHQAGHALATMLLNETEYLTKVTIRSVTKKIQEQALNAEKRDVKEKNKDAIEFGGVFTSPKEDASVFATSEQIIMQCKILLAGHIAETIILGTRSSYHDNDYEKALEKAQELIFNGLDPKKLPKDVREQLSKEAYELIQKCEAEVFELLLNNQHEVAAIAELLQEKQTVSLADIESLLTQFNKTASETNDAVAMSANNPA